MIKENRLQEASIKNTKGNLQFTFRIGKITEKEINIDIGYETFLGAESFFSPVI